MLTPKGIITAICTPMMEDETLNEPQLRVQINRQIAAGVHGIFCLGTNGEFYALTAEEKLRVIEVTVDEVKGKVPVYAGTGCVTTRETISLSQKAQRLGADALSVVSPYYAAVSQDDLYEHYLKVAENVDLPIILYNIPPRTGNSIGAATVKKLAERKNIVGVKDSSGNFDNTLRYISDTDKRLGVLAGNDSLILWTLLAGGTGAVAGTANVFPELAVEIYNLWQTGRIKEASEVQTRVRPLRDVMALANPNSVIKRAMNLLGYPVGPARSPVGRIDARIDKELMGLFEFYKELLPANVKLAGPT